MEEGMLGTIFPALMGMMMVGFMASMVQPPQPAVYCCPICGACFAPYTELESHFAAAHVAESIELVWE